MNAYAEERPVVEVEQVSKRFARFALNEITMQLHRGYITGLIGENGAGKSTLIKLLMGMSLPDAGEIRIFGKALRDDEAGIKMNIGYVADDSHFYEHLTVGAMKSVYAPFYTGWDERLFQRYIERFELASRAKIGSLSKGMKMKLSLALALSHQAELLIMDEPTAGLDPVFRRELLELLAELMMDERKSILFSTHITTDLDRVADYIAFLNRGRLVFHESRESLFDRYALVKAGNELLDADIRRLFVGIRETSTGFDALTSDRQEAVKLLGGHVHYERPTLEDIMYFTAKGGAARV